MVARSQDRRKKANATLNRTTLRTSRLLDFCSRKELSAQTGHEPRDWPLVIVSTSVSIRSRRSQTQPVVRMLRPGEICPLQLHIVTAARRHEFTKTVAGVNAHRFGRCCSLRPGEQ